ncbi:uncharacterized protein LOC132044943 [Lycium ferocissimum]|uniref:uncharacterized protein LOC132044943 n=1 Tax=Lycium ferocissimum TaxID=112874 RepID=UPI002814EC0C|nr:uncharacterized protein LOC132044943 [Lycium ferocissimum]
MLRACVIDCGGYWDQLLPLTEFAYNNSYQSSIYMAPFEALYKRRYRSPIVWFDAFEVRPWGTDLLKESLDKIKVIQDKLLVAQRRQKEYADRKARDFKCRVGKVAYKLALPPGLSGVHIVFHVSMLKRYNGDGSYIIHWDSVLLDENLSDENLSYEEETIAILDREVRKLKSKEIASVKVQWKDHPIEEATWETESDMQNKYPFLFT